jgi:hypothetical protein
LPIAERNKQSQKIPATDATIEVDHITIGAIKEYAKVGEFKNRDFETDEDTLNVRNLNSPHIQEFGEETLDGNLDTRANLRGGELARESPTLGLTIAKFSTNLIVYTLYPREKTPHGFQGGRLTPWGIREVTQGHTNLKSKVS